MTDAPERIYLQVGPDCTPEDLPDVEWSEASWCRDRVFDTDIEYVRADIVLSQSDARAVLLEIAAEFGLARDALQRKALKEAT
jgi:hypothetical protein